MGSLLTASSSRVPMQITRPRAGVQGHPIQRLNHKVVTLASTHYSLARWLEDNAGVAHQFNAVTAADLKAAFGL